MSSKRNVYLEMKTIEEARKILFDHFKDYKTRIQTLDVVDAKDRVLAKPAIAAISSPNFHAAAMDGIALDAKNTFGANEESPIRLFPGKNAFWVNTGHVMPENTNAVIMIEHIQILDEHTIEIEAPVFPWQNVRKMGEDIVATELLFPRGHQINAYCMGALLSGGIFKVQVYAQPKVLIIPTGSELVQWQDIEVNQMTPGNVVESNSHVLGALCTDHGAVFEIAPMLKDDLETIKKAVKDASEQAYDMICIIGGSSAGSEDFAKPVIQDSGELYVHGVTMMPGKPVMFGKLSGKPVFGIPGYPVSAIVAFEQFAGPLLLNMQNRPLLELTRVEVSCARKIASKLGQEEFLRVKLGSVDGNLISSQLPRGAGNITTLTKADAVIRIPKNVEGISQNEQVLATLLRPLSSIENTIVITGSHDNTLDLLADHIRQVNGAISISSSHVGSMGGLMAIKKGACHLAGAHLLDPDDGSYNISYIKKYLPDQKVYLINLVMRDQGLIVPKHNPKHIQSIADLKDKGLQFINRQPGSGTRILFDYKLKVLGMEPGEIRGYENDEYTHMSVAVSVLSGRADAGLGIHAAARALDLDFIPVVTESYDLVIPERFFDTPKIQVLLETIQTKSFKDQVNRLGGYSTHKTGTLLYP
ncbi:MAG: molybdopterin biosynthesis protein [Proteobacteria bacterium]|nr:molybdopterin biosynthesis protein [Pseudomonadota bacterium]MBU1386262.1 molybdopterin biosynthesis protein [Pseudomonadota bacterium]MBU1542955.1 molybdopterin biosynthesis protein [Pseudomonadota bacterium]MBU2479977.1 molybdopterin biosynthesis protein [Pseudomonadota bacterium]